jgi:tetratricopeptide (TPR) repeat protein
MAKHKKRVKRKRKTSGRRATSVPAQASSQPPAPSVPKFTKWLLIFGAIVCAVIAGWWGIKLFPRSDEKTQTKEPPPISTKQPEPSRFPPKLTLLQEIAALKEEKLELAKQLLREFPNSADPLVLMGNVHREQGNTAEAVKCWEKALEQNPKRTDAHNGMGWVAFEKGEYEKAISSWRKALEINPQMPDVHNSIAQTLIVLGRYDEVIKEAEEELKITPQSSLSYFLLGQGYLKQKEYEKAKKYYETAIELKPDYMNAYYGLITICSRLKLKDEAEEYQATFKKMKADERKVLMDRNKTFDDLVTIRKSLAKTYSHVENMYQKKGNFQAAEKFLRKAITLDPNNTEYLMNLGFMFQSNNRPRDALQMYEKIREIEPDNMIHHMNAGVILMQLKAFVKAETAFKKVITLDPKFSGGYRTLAQLYLKTETKLPEALKLAKTAVEVEATAENYFILSWAYDKNGDVSNARSALKKTVELEPGNPKYQQMYERFEKREARGDS